MGMSSGHRCLLAYRFSLLSLGGYSLNFFDDYGLRAAVVAAAAHVVVMGDVCACTFLQ